MSGYPVTLAMVGAGSRGRTFASEVEAHPDRARVAAVADPSGERREAMGHRHGVVGEQRFSDWRELAARPRLADAVVVTLPDREHLAAATRFAELGYHVLLEKPIARTEAECRALVEAMEHGGVIFAVCHVLRYTPYTAAVKAAVTEGRLGEIVGVQHMEPVGWWHFAHSYVRGNWRREDESSFSLMTKSCHDLDWLRYIVDRPPVRVSSVGGLRHFHPGNRPAGAGDRCVDCAVEPDCPYSAKRLYLGSLGNPQWEQWPLSVITSDLTERGVVVALRTGPYGRCVYGSDNDVADHQVVTVEFDGGVVATLTMSAFTPFAGRRTQIMGTRGFLDGDGQRVTVTDFVTGETETQDTGLDVHQGHGGGDAALMTSFLAAVAHGDASLVKSGPRESLDSHLMAFAGETSRLTGKPVTL